MAQPRWYTIKEAADRLRVSHDTVTRMIEREELPAIRVSARLIRIPASALHRIERGATVARRHVVRRKASKAIDLGAGERVPTAEPATR